jgi:hypothetical protein
MPDRRDYLAVCNDQGIPLKDFQTTFCVRCVQPECSRSRAGGLFETRVQTWEERMFANPPTMPKDDPLYGILAAKRFIEIDTGKIPNVRGPSEWMDPRALTEEPESTTVKPRPATRAPRPAPTPESSPQPGGRPGPLQAPLNTAFAQGTMLEGAPAAAAPKPDRWASTPVPAPAASETSGVPVVKVGAKIKFTGG